MNEKRANLLASIVIPTFRRNDGLHRAVKSVLALPDDAISRCEIVIADNSPERTAEAAVRELGDNSPIPVIYVWAGEPGVANARNAGVKAASTPLIAFIDDDETACEGWLDNLLKTREQFEATVVFGPVRGVVPESIKVRRGYFEAFFSRKRSGVSGPIGKFYGCGNALLDLDRIALCLEPGAPWFLKSSNETGGEDDFLFEQVKSAGGVFAWAADAVVNEVVPVDRARLAYTLHRAFGYGQGPATLCWRRRPPDFPGVAYWMGAGAAQFVLCALIAAGLWCVRAPQHAIMLDKAARGLGKLLWFEPFKARFYGATAARKTKPQQIG